MRQDTLAVPAAVGRPATLEPRRKGKSSLHHRHDLHPTTSTASNSHAARKRHEVEYQSDNDDKQARGTNCDKIRIAIIGTGLAGLVAAYHLTATAERRQEYDVHLFERSGKLGLDASSFTTEDGQRIDVPMRSINVGYYPNLMRLYRHLRIPLRNNDFTFSFSLGTPGNCGDGGKRAPFLIYNGQNGLRGLALPSSHRARLRLSCSADAIRSLASYACLVGVLLFSYICLLAMALYHHMMGHLLDPRHKLSNEPLRSWALRHSRTIQPTFLHSVLIPLFSAVATSSHAAVLDMPAAEMLLYVATTFLRSHVAVEGGVSRIQEALTQHVEESRIHLNANVRTMKRTKATSSSRNACEIILEDHDDADMEFDHVIMATPASLAASLLQSYSEPISKIRHDSTPDDIRLAEMQVQLRRIKYETSTVVSHTDQSLLPDATSDRRDLNLVTPAISMAHASNLDALVNSGKAHSHYTMATHILKNKSCARENAQGEKQQATFLQTTNPIDWPAKDSVLSVSSFQRAITPACKNHISGLFVWQRRIGHDRPSLLALLKAQVLPSPSQKPEEEALLTLGTDSVSEMVSGVRRWTFLPRILGHLFRVTSDPVGSSEPFTLHLGDLQSSQMSSANECAPRVWACGSYAQGIPLLEGCVTSSTLVAAAILSDRRSVTTRSQIPQ